MDHRVVYFGNQRCALYSGANRCTLPPYDARVEYLESSGTQFLFIPLSASANDYFEIGGEVIPLHPNNNKRGIFGTYVSSNQFKSKFFSYNSSNDSVIFDSTIGTEPTNGGYNLYVNKKQQYKVSSNGVLSYGTTWKTVNRNLTGSFSKLYIFRSDTNESGYPIRICSLYIIIGDTKVYDFLPVRVGNVGYMYDTISEKLFANAGTGNFILGPDITD